MNTPSNDDRIRRQFRLSADRNVTVQQDWNHENISIHHGGRTFNFLMAEVSLAELRELSRMYAEAADAIEAALDKKTEAELLTAALEDMGL